MLPFRKFYIQFYYKRRTNKAEERYISKNLPNRLFLPSLTISAFVVAISNSLVTLLLSEIASTFQVNEGVAVQLRTANAVAEVVFGLSRVFGCTF